MAETKTKTKGASKKKAAPRKKVLKADDYVSRDWTLYRPKELVKVAHLGDGKILIEHRSGKVTEAAEEDLAEYEPVPPGHKAAW